MGDAFQRGRSPAAHQQGDAGAVSARLDRQADGQCARLAGSRGRSEPDHRLHRQLIGSAILPSTAGATAAMAPSTCTARSLRAATSIFTIWAATGRHGADCADGAVARPRRGVRPADAVATLWHRPRSARWKAKQTTRQRWATEGDTLNASIGQGYMLANPLQLAVVAMRIASGRSLAPRLIVNKRYPPQGEPLATSRRNISISSARR